ncbi:hypothetical protein [Paenibacillus sp. FSL R7-0337]|uniref:DUF7666 domain-containing protein n=1 Tax=Paenibacillus sp. FSL R7-0337 TaxID=1926588 RepID=UPI000970019A|nr:hypothetical protein [Paenibacillus sp. FSL R7-0337]OMF98204.1 hypothetical protein BK147_11330 [Paenibacillus sp. FSL R7-0337]
MKGFKVFNKDWACRGFQYVVGQTFTHEGRFGLCNAGLHFCAKLEDCFEYYPFNPENKVAEVEALGEIENGDDKSVTNKLAIIRELTWQEVLDMLNTGKGNTGRGNSGDGNSGNRNSGDGNSGDGNSGYGNSGNRNSGDGNSGYGNSGNRNSGNRNSGNRNSGYGNSGDGNSGDGNSGYGNSGNRNSGNFNSTDYSSGSFCSEDPPFLLFNKPSPITRDEFKWSDGARICRRLKLVDDEGAKIEYKAAWTALWEELSNPEKITVQSIPNFDADVFEVITGIRV